MFRVVRAEWLAPDVKRFQLLAPRIARKQRPVEREDLVLGARVGQRVRKEVGQRPAVFRTDADRWEGIADTAEPVIARRYLAVFDEIWAASDQATEFRQLRL